MVIFRLFVPVYRTPYFVRSSPPNFFPTGCVTISSTLRVLHNDLGKTNVSLSKCSDILSKIKGDALIIVESSTNNSIPISEGYPTECGPPVYASHPPSY